jgi:hypothetical protein
MLPIPTIVNIRNHVIQARAELRLLKQCRRLSDAEIACANLALQTLKLAADFLPATVRP